MLAGQQFHAGLHVATVQPDLDFECYSAAGFVWDALRQKWGALPGASQGKKGLFVVGAAVYAEHPTTEILTMCYDLKDGRGRRRWRPGLPTPFDLFDHIIAGRMLEAWNVAFERHIWEEVAVKKLGWPAMPNPLQWTCAMGRARAFCLPGKLSEAGEVLNLPIKKDKRGDDLLKKFSWPRDPTQGDPRWRILPVWEPAQAIAQYVGMGLDVGRFPKGWLELDMADSLALLDYNETDIASEHEASIRIPDLV